MSTPHSSGPVRRACVISTWQGYCTYTLIIIATHFHILLSPKPLIIDVLTGKWKQPQLHPNKTCCPKMWVKNSYDCNIYRSCIRETTSNMYTGKGKKSCELCRKCKSCSMYSISGALWLLHFTRKLWEVQHCAETIQTTPKVRKLQKYHNSKM